MEEVRNDRDNNQFVMMVGEHKAFIDYALQGDEYQLLHAEVPAALRGQGIGENLVERTFALIKNEGKSALARCSYVRHVASNSDKWDDVVRL